jgi:hypothetical protein
MSGRTWHQTDPAMLALARRARSLLGDAHAGHLTAIELDGVRHLWGSCPFGDADALHAHAGRPHSHQIPLVELDSVRDCPACTVQLRPGGGISRWVHTHLAPVATLSADHPAVALAHCHPTRLIPAEGVTILLRVLTDTFQLRTRLAGPVRLVVRAGGATPDAHLLTSGAHAGDGHSIIAGDGPGHLGDAGEHADAAAETFLTLRLRFTSAQEAWQVAVAATQSAR